MIGCNATGTTGMDIDQSGLMLKIAFLVITHLTTGVMLRKMFPSHGQTLYPVHRTLESNQYSLYNLDGHVPRQK